MADYRRITLNLSLPGVSKEQDYMAEILSVLPRNTKVPFLAAAFAEYCRHNRGKAIQIGKHQIIIGETEIQIIESTTRKPIRSIGDGGEKRSDDVENQIETTAPDPAISSDDRNTAEQIRPSHEGDDSTGDQSAQIQQARNIAKRWGI